MQAYHQSASTLNLLRAFTKGGFADLGRVHAWTQEFVATSPRGPALRAARHRDRPGAALHAGLRDRHGVHRHLHEVDVYTSHEALLLGYEEALTRQDSLTGGWYDCSAHMLWIGERTRQLDGAHVEFLRGVGNPHRRASSDRAPRPTRSSSCATRLNPARIPGRLTLITRMGADRVEDAVCGRCSERSRDAGHPVVWACDPMHGNTFTSASGRKTRALRGHPGRDRRLRPGPPGRGDVAGRRPRRAHRSTTSPSASAAPTTSSTACSTTATRRSATPASTVASRVDLAFRVAELIHA